MADDSGVPDDDLLETQTTEALRDFGAWLGEHTHDPAWSQDDLTATAQTILHYKTSYLWSSPYQWTIGHIDELLLDVLPRKFVDDEPDDGLTVTATRSYLEFLAGTERYADGSDPHGELVAGLEKAATDYPVRMRDPSYWDMAKSAFAPGLAAGLDLADKDAVETYVAEHNRRPGTDRDRMPEGILGLLDGLPPIHRPGAKELVQHLYRTAAFTDPRNAHLVQALGPGEEGDTDPRQLLQNWTDALHETIFAEYLADASPSVVPGAARSPYATGQVSPFVVDGLFIVLFAKPTQTVEAVHALLASEFEAGELGRWDSAVALLGWLERIAPIGLHTMHPGPPARVELTDLGRLFAAEIVKGEGRSAPLVGPMEDTSPTELIQLMKAFDAETADGLFVQWRGANGSDDHVLQKLLAFAAIHPRDRRTPYFELADRLGSSAPDGARALLEDPTVLYGTAARLPLGGSVIAREWLQGHGIEWPEPETVDEWCWHTVDRMVTDLGTPIRVAEFDTLVEPKRRAEFFSRVWRIAHLLTGNVLEALGQDHPEKTVRRSARQALHKLKAPASH